MIFSSEPLRNHNVIWFRSMITHRWLLSWLQTIHEPKVKSVDSVPTVYTRASIVTVWGGLDFDPGWQSFWVIWEQWYDLNESRDFRSGSDHNLNYMNRVNRAVLMRSANSPLIIWFENRIPNFVNKNRDLGLTGIFPLFRCIVRSSPLF